MVQPPAKRLTGEETGMVVAAEPEFIQHTPEGSLYPTEGKMTHQPLPSKSCWSSEKGNPAGRSLAHNRHTHRLCTAEAPASETPIPWCVWGSKSQVLGEVQRALCPAKGRWLLRGRTWEQWAGSLWVLLRCCNSAPGRLTHPRMRDRAWGLHLKVQHDKSRTLTHKAQDTVYWGLRSYFSLKCLLT